MSVLLECCAAAAQIMKCSCKIDAATTCQDVEIVVLICGTIIWIAGIVVAGSLVWRLIDKIANGCSESRNRAKEKEEHERKQKSDLLEKKLQILKEQCYETEKDEKGNEKKKLKKDNVKTYIEAIDAAMGIKPEEKKNPTEQGKARSDG